MMTVPGVCPVCGGQPSLPQTGRALTINRNPGGSGMQSEKRIYTTLARDRIVEEGDPDAAFLVAPEGGDVPQEFAHLYREYRKASEDDDAEPRAAAAAPAEGEAPPDPDASPDAEPPSDDDEDVKARAAPARTKARARAEDK